MLLHRRRSTLHEGLNLQGFLFVGLHTAAVALLQVLVGVKDVLYARLQLFGVVGFVHGLADGNHQFLGFLTAQLLHALSELPEQQSGDG